MDESGVVLGARGVSKHFGGIHALEEVDFAVRRGEIMGLVGDNGAGKSTLVKVLTGVYQPDAGSVILEDREVVFRTRKDAKKLGIECVYQDLALVDTLDAAANVFLGAELYQKFLGLHVLSNKQMRSEAMSLLLNKLNIKLGKETDAVFNLSGGQKQSVAIGRAIYNQEIRVLIMDEPTAALGPEETEKTLALVRAVTRNGISVIIISHNLEHVFSVADRVTVLRRGRLVGIREIRSTSRKDVLSLIIGADEEHGVGLGA